MRLKPRLFDEGGNFIPIDNDFGGVTIDRERIHKKRPDFYPWGGLFFIDIHTP